MRVLLVDEEDFERANVEIEALKRRAALDATSIGCSL